MHAGQKPACDWFLEIAFIWDVSIRVCVPALEGIYVNGPCIVEGALMIVH